jgi:hypothetical protein
MLGFGGTPKFMAIASSAVNLPPWLIIAFRFRFGSSGCLLEIYAIRRASSSSSSALSDNFFAPRWLVLPTLSLPDTRPVTIRFPIPPNPTTGSGWRPWRYFDIISKRLFASLYAYAPTESMVSGQWFLFGSISICSDRFPFVRVHFHLFGPISICSGQFPFFVRIDFHLFEPISIICSDRFPFVRIDFHLFGSISICSDRFPYVRTDFHMFGSISICFFCFVRTITIKVCVVP